MSQPASIESFKPLLDRMVSSRQLSAMDAEAIENIIAMINDMGSHVYDEAPDAETLLMSDAAPPVADEDVVEQAEAALSTVDSEFGRTTDPVRMYMREMGSV